MIHRKLITKEEALNFLPENKDIFMEWNSVEDRLPKTYERVLVYGNDGIFRAYNCADDKNPCWQCDPIGSYASDGCVFGITHWMELPNPP